MANPWKKKVLEYNKRRAAQSETAADFLMLLAAIPQGRMKQLLRDEACAAILKKYGYEASEE